MSGGVGAHTAAMSAIPSEKPTPPEISGRPTAVTFPALTERLREGSLRTLLTLHVRAGVVAAGSEAADGQHLEKLVELAQLARIATAQLQDFTLGLQSLIDHLAVARRQNVQ